MDSRTIGLGVEGPTGNGPTGNGPTGNLASARASLVWFEGHGHRRRVAGARASFSRPATVPLPTADAAPLRLEVLGPMRLVSAGDVRQVRGEKRRTLLAVLLEARVLGRSHVPKLELLDTLYPGEDERKASASLKEFIHLARLSLETNLIATTPGGYALGGVTSDAEAFLAGGDASLWRGPYLDGHGGEGSVRESLYLALHRRAADLLASRAGEAARLGRLLTEAEPYHASYLALYLAALRATGNLRTLELHYHAARGRLLEVGEALPPRWQTFLEQY